MDNQTEKNIGRNITFDVKDKSSHGIIGELSGYALKFNKSSIESGPFIEYIDSSAFDGVDLSKVLALYDHDYANILGRVDAGTLKLEVNEIGLKFQIQVPDTTTGRDVYANVKAGNLKGMSFGFKVAKGGDVWERANKPIRVITQIQQFLEISVVSIPAYEDTNIVVTRSMRALVDHNYREKVRIYLDRI
ncbi:HK97 family phage prohead protease [Weissella cibaria]|uniref:HK97 family phage prohead protease n=1 Tax=Weissella cibaria TaxID=137591 RepID=UPI001CC4A2B3|nr:HK97 family phage prohead protease [Weissella cibaria]MBZ6070689.1 HK97 family phage prohead protease [Weissella cibaria]